jgi:hypothetical protein
MGPGTPAMGPAGTTLGSTRTLVAGAFRPKNASVVLEFVAATLKLNGVKVVGPMFVSEKIVVGPNITEKSWGPVGALDPNSKLTVYTCPATVGNT